MEQGRVRDWRGFGLRCLVPVMPWRDLPRLIGYTFIGAALGGIYGVIHDQVTYTIGSEYFTRLKFDQFAAANPGWGGPRVFAGIVGFLATWWVGALVAWVIARVSIWREGRLPPAREVARAFGSVFVVSMSSAFGGWCWGQWRKTTGYDEGWHGLMESLGVTRPEEFMTVAYIHNASYLGGMMGMVVGLLLLHRLRGRRLAAGLSDLPSQ